MKVFHKHHPEIGAKPGSLVISDDALDPRISIIAYGPDHHEVVKDADIAKCLEYREPRHMAWIDVQGLGDHQLLESLAHEFSIHPLALEDAVNVPVRPKSEIYEDHHLVVLRMVRQLGDTIDRSQVTLFIGDKVLITLQNDYGDVFDPVRRRSEIGARMRENGPDYLAYALIDLVIDAYYPVIEHMGSLVQALEEEISVRPSADQVSDIMALRHELQELRRDMSPMRDLTWQLLREESPFIRDYNITFLRDCYDHALQIVEVLDGYIEQTGQLVSLHSAMMGNRLNEIMKVLTIMSTIFIPLGFLAGIYGMNFEYIPELAFRYGYFTLLGVMGTLVLTLLWFFRRRGWIGGD